MPGSKKKNAYTYYVEERCKKTGLHYSQCFPLYSKDWEALSVAGKEKYFRMAEGNRPGSRKTTYPPSPPPSPTLASTFGYAPVESASAPSPDTHPEPRDYRRPIRQNSVTLTSSSSESGRDAVTKLKMSDLNLKVNHDVAEVVEEENDRGDGENVQNLGKLEEKFQEIVATEFIDLDLHLFDEILVISCVPVSPSDKVLTPIFRPLEIAVQGFTIGEGHCGERMVLHEFIDPGRVTSGSQMAVSEARRKYHQIPAACHIRADDACMTFHDGGYKLSQDYYGIYTKLLRMCQSGYQLEKPRVTMAPFLTGDDPVMTLSCIKWLREMAMEHADREGLPYLPELNLSTLPAFFAQICCLVGQTHMDVLEVVANTYSQHRYHHQTALRCPFHQQVESELCALGSVNDKIYSSFDIFRSMGFALPFDAAYVPPVASPQ